ncbi:MAG TPA: hypothetical protein PLE30_00975 [Candidatus Kapabacteria bacterium]|nr:hypothetical protein [Candidatus Kapabacteria bacterium]
MRNNIKYIISLLLLIVIAVTSFGITIHNHICGHTGTTYSSIVENNPCDELHSNSITQSEDCQNDMPCCSHEPSHQDKSSNKPESCLSNISCCSETYDHKLLDVDYLLNNQVIDFIVIESNDFLKSIEASIISYKNLFLCKIKHLEQKLRNITTISIQIINVFNNITHGDNPDNLQTA